MSSAVDVRIGSQRPTWHRSPTEVVSSAGQEAIDLAAAAGLDLDDWQRWVLLESLGERRDRTWSAFECALVVGRQNGKNAILEARELAGIVLFGDDLITHTAHRADTTLEHFRRMERYAEEFDEFGKLVHRVSRKNGDEAIELKGGRRIRFVSRARQPGRGFSGSCVVFDEALYLSAEAIGAIVPTLATRQMAQVWYTSSAPKSQSANLHSIVRRGRGDAPDDRLFFAEWGNEDGTDVDDVDGWYRANPGLGIRITEEYIRAERRLMSGDPLLEAEFRRERVGIAEQESDEADAIIGTDTWRSLVDPDSRIVSHRQMALDVSPDRRHAAFAAAGRNDNGKVHVEAFDVRPGTAWVIDRAVELYDRWRLPLRIDKSSPAASFIDLLRERGVEVVEVSTAEHAQAVGQFIDAAFNDDLRHLGALSLGNAVKGAVLRVSGDAQLWGRRQSKVDITPLVAATLALGGVPDTEPPFDGEWFVDLGDIDDDDGDWED